MEEKKFKMNDEIHHVMHYLYLKKYTAKAAMNEIHSVYPGPYPSYATAKRIFKEFGESEKSLRIIEKEKSPEKVKRISLIQDALIDNPNLSVRSIAELTEIPKSTVWRTLVSDLGLKFQVPILVPHLLNSEMKKKRVEKSIELLRVLQGMENKQDKIITGDEAWLQWSGRVMGKWQREEEPPPFSPRIPQTIKKTMIIVFFSFTEIHVCDFLKSGIKNNSQYMCEHIWPAIDQSFRKGRPVNGAKGIFLHFDNSPIHKSQESLAKINEIGFNLLEHPPYSPDIAPSDFWLFGFIDEKRKGTIASNEEELIIQTREILSKIDSTLLGTVFKEWIRRLNMVIEMNGEYLPN